MLDTSLSVAAVASSDECQLSGLRRPQAQGFQTTGAGLLAGAGWMVAGGPAGFETWPSREVVQ